MSEPFEVFGPYAVYERLGQGGMATVHRAEKRGVGIRRPVALKRLLPHVAADPALVKLFVDEARLASHLHHANVAQTYELGKVGDTFFIAMEYASGPTLAQIIRQSQNAAGEIPLTITVNILQQICEALDYAHNLCDETGQSLRIIHRDVSPANIIVTNTGVVKLIDFGIAKATISSVKTQTGFIKGKFGYIAPEYISGWLDARADLFAVGVVAHEMMSGRRLFEGADDFETLQNIREMNLQPPSHWNPHVTPDLDDIVMTALQRDPAHRWQSAGALQVALANVARAFGLVVGGQQLAEWVDWAFSQVPPDSGPVSVDSDSGYRPAPRPGSSLSIDLGRASASALGAPPPTDTLATDTLATDTLATDTLATDTLATDTLATDTLALDTPPPERARPSRRSRPPSDFDETLPLERIELSRGDIEILTPSPVIELPAFATPVPRSSRVHDAVPPPPPRVADASASPPPVARSRHADASASPPPVALSRHADASLSPPPIPRSRHAEASASPPPVARSRPSLPFAAVSPIPPRPSRIQDAVAPPPATPVPSDLAGLPALPDIASSRELEAMPALRRTAPRPAATVPPAVSEFPGPPTLPAPPPARPAGKSRPAKSTQKTRPQPKVVAAGAAAAEVDTARAPRARRSLVWLILLMIALGAGATAAAYYLPDL